MVLLAQMGPRAKEGACSCQPSWALAVLGQPPCGSGEATVTRMEQAVQPGRGEGQSPSLGAGSMPPDPAQRKELHFTVIATQVDGTSSQARTPSVTSWPLQWPPPFPHGSAGLPRPRVAEPSRAEPSRAGGSTSEPQRAPGPGSSPARRPGPTPASHGRPLLQDGQEFPLQPRQRFQRQLRLLLAGVLRLGLPHRKPGGRGEQNRRHREQHPGERGPRGPGVGAWALGAQRDSRAAGPLPTGSKRGAVSQTTKDREEM